MKKGKIYVRVHLEKLSNDGVTIVGVTYDPKEAYGSSVNMGDKKGSVGKKKKKIKLFKII